MKQKKKYKKALKKIQKLAEMPTSETPQQRIKRLKGIAEKALFIPDVVGQSEQFNCLSENYAKGIKRCSEWCGEDICQKPSN